MLVAEDAYGRTQIEMAGQCIGLLTRYSEEGNKLLEPCSHRGQDMGVAHNH